MFKTFIFGIVLGLLAAAGVVYFVPVVDQHREPSLVSVEPNGGNRETFHINLPQDRIISGAAGASMPETLEWPATGTLANARAELFKVRDGHDVVVGVACRISGSGETTGSVVEWTLHLPARGTLYLTMQPVGEATGYRRGLMRTGTREFAGMTGRVEERFVDLGGDSPDATTSTGRIELATALFGAASEAG